MDMQEMNLWKGINPDGAFVYLLPAKRGTFDRVDIGSDGIVGLNKRTFDSIDNSPLSNFRK